MLKQPSEMSSWLFCLKFSSLGPFLVCALTMLLKPQYLLFEVFSGVYVLMVKTLKKVGFGLPKLAAVGLEYLREGQPLI